MRENSLNPEVMHVNSPVYKWTLESSERISTHPILFINREFITSPKDGQLNKNGTLFSRIPFVINVMISNAYWTDESVLLILLNTLPMTGPRIIKTAITTTATKTRIKAYSTKPWPFSFGANNMGFHLLSF